MQDTQKTSKVDDLGLEKVGITHWKELHRNSSFEELSQDETDPSLDGFECGVLTEFGAVAVDTGRFTGRSPKDKYVVVEETSKDHIWWARKDHPGSDNKAISQETWRHLHEVAKEQLNGKRLYVVDGFCGAHRETRLNVRIITEVAWQAHFCKNMFIRPSDEELKHFVPDWTVLSASKTTCKDYEQLGLRSEVFAAFNIKERMTLIGGTWYGGEIKKGIFTIMNYFLPLKGIGSFHCSANMDDDGDTALFFGLSGTGKTTLSVDENRSLIGDDEHGWDNEGIFNFEAGCYAKIINLSQKKEPGIYHAIRRNALLENVVVDSQGRVDFSSSEKTENTRVSYPIYHIDNIVKPVSKGRHPSKLIFLTCDAFGVLPPVVRFTSDQATYQFLSGYTAKVAGTELGVVEPTATFSSCFGAPFLALHPTVYAELLGRKMLEHKAQAYGVNTGWIGGGYGVGQRIDIDVTRTIVSAALDGTLDKAEFEPMPIFGFEIPKALKGIDPQILNPRNTWADKEAYEAAARELAAMFIENFKAFTDTEEGKRLEAVGPQI